MKIFKKLFSISIMLVTGFFCVSQEGQKQTLTIEDAVNLANQNNITIKTSQGSLNLLKAKNTFSWNSVSPSVSVKGSFADDFENEALNYGITGTVSMALSTNLISSINGAKIAYESGKLTYEQTCRKIELSVRTSFYALLYEQENLRLQKQNLSTAKSQYEQNQEKFKNGQISELDVMQSRVNYEQKIPTVQSIELQFNNDLATFKQLIGMDQKTELVLDGSLEEILKIKKITLPECSTPAPDVMSAEYDVQTAQNNLLASRFSAYGPVISATYNYGKGQTYVGAADTTTDTTTNSLSIGVSIPLDGYLPWSTGAASIASSKVNVENAKMQLENTKTTVAIQTENYIRKINQGIAQVASLQSTADLAKQSYNMTKTAYNYGKADFLTLQSASDNVLSSQVSLQNQAYSLISTILNLEYLLGLPYGTLTK